MISLNKEQTCLLELVKASLFGAVPVFPKNVNWEKVFELAKAQCIVPLAASFVPEAYRSEWKDISCQSKARYMQLLYAQNTLVNLLKKNDIPYIILKGTAAAIYYPSPSLRTFGDIDFLVPKDFFDYARESIENEGFSLVNKNDRHYEYEKNGIQFELHSRFSIEFYNDIDSIVLNGLNNSVDYRINSFSFSGLPSFENGLVLLGHIMQHIKDSGIGFRQIIDWMLFVNKELDDSAWFDHFQTLAIEAGLEKLAVTVTYMCKKWLGLPNKISWCNTADEDVSDQLLIRILDDGNFGHERAPNERVKKKLKNIGTFKYLQNAGTINWPLAQKYSIFRPFAWLYQLCRYAGKGIVGLFTGKKVFMKNKNIMSLEELWEKLE